MFGVWSDLQNFKWTGLDTEPIGSVVEKSRVKSSSLKVMKSQNEYMKLLHCQKYKQHI